MGSDCSRVALAVIKVQFFNSFNYSMQLNILENYYKFHGKPCEWKIARKWVPGLCFIQMSINRIIDRTHDIDVLHCDCSRINSLASGDLILGR